MANHVVAVDGPSASGKSTVSRQAAAALGYLYVDSGALYRAVTWQVLNAGKTGEDRAAVVEVLTSMNITFLVKEDAIVFEIDGYQPTNELRSEAVRDNVSPVAAIPEVRSQVTKWLQSMAQLGSLVMEGRDIGSAVFPDSPFKFFLDADPEERARRRHAELEARNENTEVGKVLDNLTTRDKIDSSRKTNPLTLVDGALVIDSTGMSIDDVVNVILDKVGAES